MSVEDKTFELIVEVPAVASDLRIINSCRKIAYDFERYGRYARAKLYLGVLTTTV